MIKKVRKSKGTSRIYSDAFKQKVLNAIITEGIMPTEAKRRFGITNESTIRNWIIKYNDNFISLSDHQEITKDMSNLSKQELENKVKELEKQLSYEKMKSHAFDTMIDVAERELKISIRKKSVTKQSKN